jgi:spermidine synthase
MDETAQASNSIVKTLNVYFIFCASGVSALIYQVLWARWLGLLFGNTTISISIVLGSFMLGLALGSIVVGRWLFRIKNPMRVYALLEMLIGCFAILFPYLTDLVEKMYLQIISTGSPEILRYFIMSIFAFCLISIPTTMMGATLPLLTDFFKRSPRYTTSWKVGILYATNTVGAAIGSILSGFFLIELLGVHMTMLVAAALNFSVAFAGYKFSSSPLSQEASTKKVKKQSVAFDGKLALFVLAAGGGVALASEVLWTRLLEIIVGNSTYAFSMILVLYLLGIALGSWLSSMGVTWLIRKVSLSVALILPILQLKLFIINRVSKVSPAS